MLRTWTFRVVRSAHATTQLLGLAAVVFTTTAFLAAPSYGHEVSMPLLPLAPGTEWRYQVNSVPENVLTETALDEIEINDDGLTRTDAVPVADDFFIAPTTTFYVKESFSRRAQIRIARILSDGDKFTFRPPIPMGSEISTINVGLKVSISDGIVGVRLSDDPDTLVGIDYSSIAEVLATSESVTVPAGTYDTVKIRLDVTLNGQLPGESPLVDALETRVYWFAEGVGIVKRTITSDGETDTFELVGSVGDSDGDGIIEGDNCPDMFNPQQENFDGDALGDVCDPDDDQDGVADADDAFPLDPTESVDTDSDGVGNGSDEDDDGDQMPDTFELKHGLDPLNPDDAAQDLDGDGVSNLEEFQAGRNPTFDERLLMILLRSSPDSEEE